MTLNSLPALGSHPRVTIVTPSYNQGHFIRATIDSVLAQDYPHIDYVVMDGGSTDGTIDILRSYGDRLRWRSGPDGGQSAAINAGWQSGQGEIVAWLNSDDLYAPNAVSVAISYLQANPDIAAVYGQCISIDADGREIGRVLALPPNYLEMVRTAQSPIPQPAMFMRRAAVAAVGWLDPRLHMAMDFDLWLRLGLRYPFGFVPAVLAYFRTHPSAKSTAQSFRFGPELIAIYTRLFAQAELPAELRRYLPEAISAVLAQAANHFFVHGRLRAARRLARAALPHARGTARRITLKVLLIASMGHLAWQTFMSVRMRGSG